MKGGCLLRGEMTGRKHKGGGGEWRKVEKGKNIDNWAWLRGRVGASVWEAEKDVRGIREAEAQISKNASDGKKYACPGRHRREPFHPYLLAVLL